MTHHRKPSSRRSIRRLLRPFTTMTVVIGLVAGAEMSGAIATEFLAAEERHLTELLNEERVADGLEALPTADALRTVSRRHTVRMMQDGKIYHAAELQREVEEEFPEWAKIGENVGVGGTIPAVHDAFMDSPGHRANILDDAWQTLGIGVVPGGGRLWMTQRFLRLMSGTPIPPDALAEEDTGATAQSAGNGPETQRVAGTSRIATAEALVTAAFAPGSADGAVLADAFDYHGALAGAALAGALNGPVVMTSTSSLAPEAADALTRALGANSGKTVHLVGTFAPAVISSVEGLGLTVAVHDGANFAAAAAAAARALPEAPDSVIISRDDNFPDALAAAAVAAKTGWPILFTATGSLTTETSSVIIELGAKTAHILGGPNAVSDNVARQIAELGLTTQRHAGTGRIATALRIAELGLAQGLDGTSIMLATSQSFPDALAGGAAAPRLTAPVLLTGPGALSAEVRAWLQERPEITKVFLLGGTGALATQVQVDITNLR